MPTRPYCLKTYASLNGTTKTVYTIALLLEKHQILSEPLHSRALQHALNNLDRELVGQSTDDPEVIDGGLHSLPLLYCLHIERNKDQPDNDFNIHYLCGWRYSNIIIDLAKKNSCPLYKAWQHLIQTGFQVLEADLTIPEPRYNTGLSMSNPPIIDLTTLEPAVVVDLSTPEPDQLVPALSLSARALAIAQYRPPGLQLLTPDLRRYLLNWRSYPRPNLVTIEVAYYSIIYPERLYC
jgi:hypothetical protein